MADIPRQPIFSPIKAPFFAPVFLFPNITLNLPTPPRAFSALVETKYRTPPDAGSVSGMPIELLTFVPPLPAGTQLLNDIKYRIPPDAGYIYNSFLPNIFQSLPNGEQYFND